MGAIPFVFGRAVRRVERWWSWMSLLSLIFSDLGCQGARSTRVLALAESVRQWPPPTRTERPAPAESHQELKAGDAAMARSRFEMHRASRRASPACAITRLAFSYIAAVHRRRGAILPAASARGQNGAGVVVAWQSPWAGM